MNITVNLTNSRFTHLTGGECGVCSLNIDIDKKLPTREQRILIIHSIIENYFRSIEHSKIDELTDLIQDALDQLETTRRK